MIYTDLTRMAVKVAYEAHHGQTDKGGVPYIFHPYRVAEKMTDEISTCVALLHDVIEDTAVTMEDLGNLGFPAEVLHAVDLLTHRKNTPYMEYILKIKENDIASRVKLADLEDNSDFERLGDVDAGTRHRLWVKYAGAKNLIERGFVK